MTESPTPVSAGKTSHALDELRAFVSKRRSASAAVTDFEWFEGEARRRFAAAEAEFVAEELARLDVDAPAVEIDGMGHRRVLRCPQDVHDGGGADRRRTDAVLDPAGRCSRAIRRWRRRRSSCSSAR